MEKRPTPVVRTVSFEDRGLVVLSPYAADFDARVLKASPIAGPHVLACKPWLTIIENRSDHVVVAYSVKFASRAEGALPWANTVHFRFPRAVAGNDPRRPVFPRGREIFPNEIRVITPEFELAAVTSMDDRWFETRCTKYRQMVGWPKEAEIAIDAAIFDDGSKVGPDEGGLENGFTTEQSWMQRLLKNIVGGLEKGTPIDDAMADSERLLPNFDDSDVPRIDTVMPLLAFSELVELRHRVGDREVRSVFASAIRASAFVVHR